jgi:hypothetical protein
MDTCGEFGGHCGCGARTPPGAKASLRETGRGAIVPLVGPAENNEFGLFSCANARGGTSNAKTIANAGHSRIRAAIAGVGLMAGPFSAQIEAISSLAGGLSPPVTLC